MTKKDEETDQIYYIPSNFIDTGTLFGGMVKLRNMIEAAAAAIVAGLPILRLHISATAKIIIACFTVLPLGLFAVMGVSGESLSSFIVGFIKFVKNRRVLGSSPPMNKGILRLAEIFYNMRRSVKRLMYKLTHHPPKKRDVYDFDGVKTVEIPEDTGIIKNVADYLPVLKIENGIIYTRDRRYVKIIEIEPVNFLLRSAREQKILFIRLSAI